MISGKSFFIDQTRCIACRGCQVACKQWKNQKVVATRQQGTYQNPPDLDSSTFKLIRFSEVEVDGKLKWLFFPEQCRHCVEPPCKTAADAYDPEAIVIDKDTGAVIYTERTKAIKADDIRGACPYDIPRQDPATGYMTKCNMCIDRVRNGLLPACVKTCPSETMHFGDRAEMLELAQKRLAEVQKTRPKAQLVDAEYVRVIYLAEVDPGLYYKRLMSEREEKPRLFARRDLLRGLTRGA